MYHLQGTRRASPLGVDRIRPRPFSDWFADAQRQCERRTGVLLFANGAPDRYWLSAYQCGMTAWEAADAFIQESRS